MAAQDCIKEIQTAASNQLSDDELTDLVESLQREKAARAARTDLKPLEETLLDAADSIASDAVEAAKIERRNRLINIQRFNELLTLAERANSTFNDPAMGLQAAMVGVTRVMEGGRRSVDARGNGLASKYLGGLLADLRRENLLMEFNAKELEVDLARDLEAVTNPNAQGSGNPKTRRIAEIVDKYRKASIGRANRAGAWIKPLPGYITRQTHDMHKIRRAGFEQWKNHVIPLLDAKNTFGDADPEEFLKSAYAGLSTGVHLKHGAEADVDLKLAFKGPGNLGKRLSQTRVLHFKSADDFMAYNREFGSRSLTEGIFSDLERMARSTALMEVFGPNPKAMFDKVRDELKAKHRDAPEKVDQLNAQRLNNAFDQIDGTARTPVNPTMSQWSAGFRAIQSMAKLGGSVLSAMSDVAFHAGELHRQGIPLMESWGKAMGDIVEGFTTDAERREFAELLGAGIEGQLGDIYTRFSAVDDVPGAMSKMMRVFFKANLLGPWTDANKRGFALMFARHLGMQKQKPFSALGDDMTRMMGRYGIGEKAWDIARQAIRQDAQGKDYLMPDLIQELPDSLFTGSAREIQRQKDEIETAFRSFLVDRADIATPTPGARERAILQQGTQPGTVMGEVIRFLGQFKAFPVTAMTKNFGETLYSKGAVNFRQAMFEGKGDMVGLVNMIIGTTVLGYVAQSAKEITKGRTPRDPFDLSTWQAAMLQGGGLGIYGDFLLGETNRFGRSLLDTLAGPTLGTISDLDELRAKLIAGDPVGASSLRLLMSNTPFANLFYTKTALDYLILYQVQESINPGYLRRMERRIQQENGQEFIIPPSRVIPRGGGNQAFEAVR